MKSQYVKKLTAISAVAAVTGMAGMIVLVSAYGFAASYKIAFFFGASIQ